MDVCQEVKIQSANQGKHECLLYKIIRLLDLNNIRSTAYFNSKLHLFILSVLVWLIGCVFLFCFLQLDEEFLSRQEAQTQLVKCEEKVAELQAELQAYRSQVQRQTLYIVFFPRAMWGNAIFDSIMNPPLNPA